MGLYGDSAIVIETIDPDSPHFDYFLWLAQGWTQQRKKYYFRTGGYQELQAAVWKCSGFTVTKKDDAEAANATANP